MGVGAAQTSSPPQKPPPFACITIARAAVAVTIKNERGQVLNKLENLYYTPRAMKQISIWWERTGRWTVSVNRLWYRPVTMRGIRVEEDRCGPVRPTLLIVQLKPTLDAPRIREFSLLPASAEGLSIPSWPYFQRFRTVLDAPSIASGAVVWSSSDPGVATVDQTGMFRVVCNRTSGWTTITATLKADPTVKVSTRLRRIGGGMVCKRGAVDR